ncbi:MAG: hypothetical protein ABIK85_03430 [Candidatus Eisenbacteria bacterium]
MTLGHRHIASRGRLAAPAAALLVLVCACLVICGCARHVSLAELGSSEAVVWVRLTTSDDERITGQVVSLDAGSMVVAARYELGGDIQVRERDGDSVLYSGTERVPGRFVGIDSEEQRRVAIVHRTFPAIDIAIATFHESRGERSLASIVSLLLGPAIGGAIGFFF